MVSADSESRIPWVGKIHMKLPGLDLSQCHAAVKGTINSQEKFVPSRRRRAAGAKTRGDQTISIAQSSGIDREPDRVGRTTVDHAGTVQRIDTHAIKREIVSKLVHREEIGVLGSIPPAIPQGELGIITQSGGVRRIHLQRVEPPAAADGVASLGHTNALPE
jgi:hypothetical protein